MHETAGHESERPGDQKPAKVEPQHRPFVADDVAAARVPQRGEDTEERQRDEEMKR